LVVFVIVVGSPVAITNMSGLYPVKAWSSINFQLWIQGSLRSL